MEKIVVDKSFLEKYIRGTVHKAQKRAADIYYHLSFHFDGYSKHWAEEESKTAPKMENPYFSKLIDQMRPSENVQIKAYRRDIYLPVTKASCFKVYNSLKKIVKSPDWKIDYSKSEKPKTIVEGESLEDYCEKNYPIYDSVENWAYSYCIRQMLIDPNALIVVMPRKWDVDANEYLKPYAYIVNCRQVLDIDEEYVVFISDKVSYYRDAAGVDREGKIIYVVTKDSVWECREKLDQAYEIEEHVHNIGHIPAWLMGGTILKEKNNIPIYESFISPILPSLDAAARESSDLDAEVVQHIFSTMWYYSGQECPDCRGVGKVNKNGDQVLCATCEGTGAFKKSPYKDIAIKPVDTLDGKGATPTPPAGYIIKPTDIVKIQDERIQNHLFRALSAINMEFLATTPLNQSGVAKEVDRDELNNFVYSIAYHLVENVLSPVYYFINEWRNKDIVQDEKVRIKMTPQLTVPEKFNLLTENIIQDQIKAARDAGVSDDIISYLELDYINKKFANYPELRDRLVAMKQLDPLVSKTSDEKVAGMSNDTILKFDVVKSTYMESFIDRAIKENPDFLKEEFEKQKEIIDEYTQEKMDELDSQGSSSTMQEDVQIEDPNNPGFDMEGNPMIEVQVEDPKNKGFDMKGQPMMPKPPKGKKKLPFKNKIKVNPEPKK